MLAESEAGLKGLHALFELYRQAGRMSTQLIAAKLEYEVILSDYALFQAYVHTGHKISIPRIATGPIRDFLLYHEIAHVWLERTDRLFFMPLLSDKLNRLEYREMENWCDSFAVAMLFAYRGVMVMEDASHQEFLAYPQALAGEHTEFEYTRSRLQGRRILGLAPKYFSSRGASRVELVGLGYALLQEAERVNPKTKKAAS